MLRKAAEIVDGARHGRERSFDLTAKLWMFYLDKTISPQDVAILLALLKVARSRCGLADDPDHYVDAAAYLALAGEMATADRTALERELAGAKP